MSKKGFRNIALGTALAAGSFFAGGCRTAYVPETPKDREHHAVMDRNRFGGYSTGAGNIDSDKGLEEVVLTEYVADAAKYTDLGKDANTDYAGLAARVDLLNARAKNALAGSDAVVVRLYEHLNEEKKGWQGDGKLDERLARVSYDLDELTKALSDGSVDYKDLIELEERASKSRNAKLTGDVKELVKTFKDNARKLGRRTSAYNALSLTEGFFDEKMLLAEDTLEGIATGARYSEVAPGVIGKVFSSREIIDSNIEAIISHIESDEPTSLDDAIRGNRFVIMNPVWRAYTDGKIDGKEEHAVAVYLDSAIARRAALVEKDGTAIKVLKRVGKSLVPFWPGVEAARNLSHMFAPDTATGFVDESGIRYPGGALTYAMLVRAGATNGDHVVGDKGTIMLDGVLWTVTQIGQGFAIYKGVDALTSPSSSSSAPAAAESTPNPVVSPPPLPIDF